MREYVGIILVARHLRTKYSDKDTTGLLSKMIYLTLFENVTNATVSTVSHQPPEYLTQSSVLGPLKNGELISSSLLLQLGGNLSKL